MSIPGKQRQHVNIPLETAENRGKSVDVAHVNPSQHINAFEVAGPKSVDLLTGVDMAYVNTEPEAFHGLAGWC